MENSDASAARTWSAAETYVFRQFKASCDALNPLLSEIETAREWDRVSDHYREPHRQYHTLDHVADMIRKFRKFSIPAKTLRTLILFAVYHDVIYDTRSSKDYAHNEERSALLARDALTELDIDKDIIADVEALIRATKTHKPDKKLGYFGRLALDVDMSILGAARSTYDRYRRHIRNEFNVLSSADFRAGRKAFLKAALKQKRIFATDFMHEIYGRAARTNMKRELKKLKSPRSGKSSATSPAGP